MLEIAIMLEGQNGLTWSRWQKIVRLVEELGFVGLYRSDHFTNSNAPDLESLELWTSLTWLACNTQRIEFGPLVTPFSFRHPVFTARRALAVPPVEISSTPASTRIRAKGIKPRLSETESTAR